MANIRKSIRDAIVTRLNVSLTEPVYAQRYLAGSALPIVNVLTIGDTSEKDKAEIWNKRSENVIIIAQVSGLEAHEGLQSGELSCIDKLDALVSQIESNFDKKYETLDTIVYRMNYVSTDIEMKVDGENVIGTAAIRYVVMYQENLV